MDELINLFGKKDWFHSVGHDQYGRLIVYIKHSTHETLTGIPDRVDGKQVLVHFASSLTASKDQFANVISRPESVEPTLQEEMDSLPDLETISNSSLLELTNELDKLEKICGSNILQDIFYEVHDGGNAVTNLSARYPEVRMRLNKLYQQYGFDIIYEELDG